MAYPLVFGTVLAVSALSLGLATPQSTNVVFSLFFFLNPLLDILTAISQNLVFIGHD